MENTNEITVGNFTVAKKAFDGLTLDEAKKTFKHVDARHVEKAYNIANPKKKAGKKKAPKKEQKPEE